MKNIVVIGAASGIGKALCESLLNEGHHVWGSFNESTPSKKHPNLHLQKLNVLEEGMELEELPDTIDGFVYCPGAIKLKPFSKIKATAFIEDFNLQVLGAIKLIQQILPALKASANASIILFSTIAVQKGFNFHSQVSVSKGAIEGLTKALAAELAPSIRINAIAPSLTDTPLASKLLSSDEKRKANADRHPLRRIGKPEDVANLAVFLLSEKSSWMTGQILHIDGGLSTIKM